MIYGVKRSVLSYIFIPFLCFILLAGIFSLVRLRSRIVSVEYSIGELERQKLEALKDIKAFEAERAALLSVGQLADMGFGSPDRKKVIYVKRDTGVSPYVAALRKGP